LAASAAISSEVFIPSLNDHTLDEIKERWFLMEDLRSFKSNAKQTSKRSLSDVAAITLLKNSFVFVPKKSKNKKNNNNKTTPIDPLVMWCCQHANMRRGLEQWSNREHGQYRQRARRELIQSVVTRQAVLKQCWYKSKSVIHNNSNDDCYRHPFNNNNNNCGNNTTTNLNYVALMENILAQVSSERSYDAQVFAQRMGLADAAAAAFDNYMTMSMSMTYYYDQSFVLQCYDNNNNNTMNNNNSNGTTTTTVLMVKQQDEEGKKEEPTAAALFFNNKTTSSAVTTKSLSSSSKSFFRLSGNRKKTLSYPPSSTMRLASIPRNLLRKKK